MLSIFNTGSSINVKVSLEPACGFVGYCHLDAGAEEGVEITLTEFAFVFEATKFGYLG